jgi:AcrR family transcriptional regulator
VATDPTQPAGSAERRDDDRAAILDAMLSLSGELGYRQVTAERIAERTGRSVGGFYSQFSGREECFAIAYELEADELLARILGGAGDAGRDCRERAQGALVELFTFATAEEAVARAVMAEVYVAGGAALAKHQAVLERLSRVVADACRETHPSRHDPPPVTARFIVGGLEEAVRRRLAEGQAALLWDDLPELTSFFLGAYSD